MNCKTCKQSFKTASALISHNKSEDHELRVFIEGHQKNWRPVSPAQLQRITDRVVLKESDVIYGPRLCVRRGFTHSRAKYRSNPWIRKRALKRALHLTQSHLTFLSSLVT